MLLPAARRWSFMRATTAAHTGAAADVPSTFERGLLDRELINSRGVFWVGVSRSHPHTLARAATADVVIVRGERRHVRNAAALRDIFGSLDPAARLVLADLLLLRVVGMCKSEALMAERVAVRHSTTV